MAFKSLLCRSTPLIMNDALRTPPCQLCRWPKAKKETRTDDRKVFGREREIVIIFRECGYRYTGRDSFGKRQTSVWAEIPSPGLRVLPSLAGHNFELELFRVPPNGSLTRHIYEMRNVAENHKINEKINCLGAVRKVAGNGHEMGWRCPLERLTIA